MMLAVPSAHAGLITWQFNATIDATTDDPLGIDGESFSLTVLFDDDAHVWTDIGGLLNYPSLSATASIGGGHTVALNTPMPAAGKLGLVAAILEGVGSTDWVDWIIDGTFTQSISFTGSAALMASPGDAILPEHLPQSIASEAGFGLSLQGDIDYVYENAEITITRVPEPSTLLVLVVGLVGIMRKRRWR